jgi:tetratricopeptide (TPR) repeat protein
LSHFSGRSALALVFASTFVCPAPVLAQDAASLVAEAREAARQDQNRRAADLLGEAIARVPALRAELLHEYADQLTYSDRSAQAVPLYREVLARTGLGQSERERALRGLALALSWSGAHAEAVGIYSDLLAGRPNDIDARLNRARVETWRRRYSAAERDYQAVLAAEPANAQAIRGLAEAQSLRGHQREALATLAPLAGPGADADTLVLLARTQNWSGRADLADESIGRALNLRADHPEALRLQREIALARRPRTEISASYSDQSNETDFATLSAWQRFFPRSPLNMVAIGHSAQLYRQEGGADIDVHRPAVEGRLRYADWGEVNAELGLNIENEPADTDYIPTYSVWTSIAPSDRLRFDVGTSRQTLDNVRSMLLDITTTSYGGSVDIGSDAATRFSLRGNHTAFSDGNERLWGQAEVRQRLFWSPNVFLGARYTRLGFSRLLDNGYFNPDRLEAIELTGQVWGRSGRFYYDVRGSLGREDAVPGGERTVYALEGRLTHLLTERIELEGFVNTFSSRIATPGGFSRSTAGLSLRVRW